jgi:hypothetical protein
MSSLSRRACFKCGNVGHYAGMASSPAPLACRRPAVRPVPETLLGTYTLGGISVLRDSSHHGTVTQDEEWD